MPTKSKSSMYEYRTCLLKSLSSPMYSPICVLSSFLCDLRNTAIAFGSLSSSLLSTRNLIPLLGLRLKRRIPRSMRLRRSRCMLNWAENAGLAMDARPLMRPPATDPGSDDGSPPLDGASDSSSSSSLLSLRSRSFRSLSASRRSSSLSTAHHRMSECMTCPMASRALRRSDDSFCGLMSASDMKRPCATFSSCMMMASKILSSEVISQSKFRNSSTMVCGSLHSLSRITTAIDFCM
mmetsp:Transcript_2668/g.3924  ORF Transcript_2668/g.3924 Transcript_2668/m.3924 type:complete len:237 (-) Transcript_2668:1493-2203(-)